MSTRRLEGRLERIRRHVPSADYNSAQPEPEEGVREKLERTAEKVLGHPPQTKEDWRKVTRAVRAKNDYLARLREL